MLLASHLSKPTVINSLRLLNFVESCSLSETRKMQCLAREHIKRVMDEQEMLNMELVNKKKRLDSWSRELKNREALTERERQKLEEEKEKASHFPIVNEFV